MFHNASLNGENTGLLIIIKTFIPWAIVYISGKPFLRFSVTFQILYLIIVINTALAIIFFKEFAIYHRKSDTGRGMTSRFIQEVPLIRKNKRYKVLPH